MAMNQKLLRPKASGVHPEAAAWRTAVIANGGSVSSTTLAAVNVFCKAIDANGLRSRFYRLNLFCGGNLSSALVPLYRGPSRSGTQYGNATETNLNFVGGDYVETGASGGLNSGASNASKYLRTGIAPSNMSAVCTDAHASVYSRAVINSTSQGIGAQGYSFFPGYQGDKVYFRTNGSSSGFEGTLTTTSGHILAVRTGATAADLYRNGSSRGATPANNGTTSSETAKLVVFGQADGSENAVVYLPATLQMYSLGVGMTASQAGSFYSSILAFQTALTRNL